MSTVSTIGYGIKLAHSTTSGGTYTAIAELLDLTPPPENVDEVKVYRSDNTAAVVERIPGWTEVGDCSMKITYNPSQRSTLQSLRGVPGFWKVTYPLVTGQTASGDTELFAGFIKELGAETPLKDSMTCQIKIAVNGDITYTQGS
jgi:hypothetical protein